MRRSDPGWSGRPTPGCSTPRATPRPSISAANPPWGRTGSRRSATPDRFPLLPAASFAVEFEQPDTDVQTAAGKFDFEHQHGLPRRPLSRRRDEEPGGRHHQSGDDGRAGRGPRAAIRLPMDASAARRRGSRPQNQRWPFHQPGHHRLWRRRAGLGEAHGSVGSRTRSSMGSAPATGWAVRPRAARTPLSTPTTGRSRSSPRATPRA